MDWDIDKTRWYMKHFDKPRYDVPWAFIAIGIMMVGFALHVAVNT